MARIISHGNDEYSVEHNGRIVMPRETYTVCSGIVDRLNGWQLPPVRDTEHMELDEIAAGILAYGE